MEQRRTRPGCKAASKAPSDSVTEHVTKLSQGNFRTVDGARAKFLESLAIFHEETVAKSHCIRMLSISRILNTTVMVAAVQRLLQINSVRWHIFFNAETSQVGAVQRFLLFNCDRSQFLFFFFYYRNQISILQHCLAIQLFRCRNPDFSNSTLVWSYNFFTAETPILAIQHWSGHTTFSLQKPRF